MSGELIRAQLPADSLYEDTGSMTDYAHIGFNKNTDALVIAYKDVWHQVQDFDHDGLNNISTSDLANNRVIFGSTAVYSISFLTASDVAGAPAVFTFDAFDVSQTTVGITAITKANPGVVETDAAHNLIAGDFVKITGCTTMTEPNDKVWIVGTVADTTHFEIHDAEDVNMDSSGWGVHDAGTGDIAEALRSCGHTENKYTNGVLDSKAAPEHPHAAILGDAIELYARNRTNNGNLTMENGCLIIKRW